MSVVTNVILTFGIGEKDIYTGNWYEHPIVMDVLNGWLAEKPIRKHRGFHEVDQHVGGEKAFETPIYAAAFNHFDLEEFLDYVEHMPWVEPECVQVMYQCQDEETFTVVFPCVKGSRA